MNADLCAAVAAAQSAHLDEQSWPAILQPKGADPIDCGSVGVAELPDGLIQQRYGTDYGRMVEATIQAAELDGYLPARNDILSWSSGPAIGDWGILSTERRDAVVVIVRARKVDRVDAIAAGVRKLRS